MFKARLWMSTYMQAQLKRACMWTREHVYISACVGAKTDWVSGCLCIHPSIRLSMGMYLNIYIWMLLSATLSKICVSVRPSVCQPVCMPTCKFLCPTICSYVHPFICTRECLFQRVNVSACPRKGKTICLSFYLIVNPPIRTNVTI